MKLARLKPSVRPWVLLFLSGAMWAVVGTMLIFKALCWLYEAGGYLPLVLAPGGVMAAILFQRFSFRKLVGKNIVRISVMNEQPCIFAFQSLKSWGIVVMMIGLGLALRHSSVPRQYLAVPYLAVGGALAFSSLGYWREIFSRLANR